MGPFSGATVSTVLGGLVFLAHKADKKLMTYPLISVQRQFKTSLD